MFQKSFLVVFVLPFVMYSFISLLASKLWNSYRFKKIMFLCTATDPFPRKAPPTVHTYTHTQPLHCSSGTRPGPPMWAGTREVKPGR